MAALCSTHLQEQPTHMAAHFPGPAFEVPIHSTGQENNENDGIDHTKSVQYANHHSLT